MATTNSTTGWETTRRPSSARSDTGIWPRAVNLVLGAWLFVSAFIWPHSYTSQANTWIVGGLIALVALFAMWMPAARFANTALSAWLFISTFFIVHLAVGTVWHNAIVAAIVFLVSLVPSHSLQRGGSSRAGYGPMQPTT